MAYTTIKKPSDYFNTKLYTGDGTSSNAITGVGFQPDWVWIKSRNLAYAHNLVDIVRGASNTLSSNSNANENYAGTGDVLSFDSDGFSVRNTANWVINGSGNTYASWNWLASNTTASNTDGSITSTVSANTTSGFSIVTYTGTSSAETIGHGLNSAPKVVIVKRRSSGGTQNDWSVFHSSLPVTNILNLNLNGAAYDPSFNDFQDTAPTSDVFYITATAGRTNANGIDYVAYCFAEKKGFSKFGSYTGNGSTDGTFVYTGFKPAFVIVKRTNTTGSWMMFDNKRNTFNPEDKFLYSDLSNAEGTLTALDFVSNGFKFRNADTFWNASGSTYIYMAFAEEPLVGDNPATAR